MTRRGAPKWTAGDIPDQSGRTFVVTGANSGLGYVTAAELARHGGRVIMAVRNEAKGRQALDRIRAAHPDAAVEQRHLDLADLDSVRAFADGIVADRVPVDVLINNAGIMMPPRSLTRQGFETQFGGNHLGHVALTGRLLGTLKTGRDARVVTVSSGMHHRGSIRFDDLSGEKGYSPTAYYSQSKLANALFGIELDRRLRESGAPVRSLLAHPGYAATNLQRTGPTGLMNAVMRLSNRLLAQSMEMGALSQLYAATDPAAESGQYIGPDGRGELWGYPTVVRPSASAQDPALARRLWTLSEELTGVRFELSTPALSRSR
jgi:NAD(P)-dependent dehydrogenase (short-subunit alcohol dehydrogenase family)